MKNILNTFQKVLLVGVVCAATNTLMSCKKTLEVDPYSYFTSANFFTDVNEATMATLGVYEVMSSQDTYGWFIPLVLDADNDVSQLATGADDYRNIGHYLGISQNPTFYTVWSKLYAGIDRANIVIEKIPQMTQFISGAETEKLQLNRLLGEAKFLRGFYYSELVRLWGDVPYKTKSSQAGDNLRGSLVDRYEIFAGIIKDMQEATDLLPEAVPTDERVNKWAVKAILARVALFAGGYSLANDGMLTRPENYVEYYQLAKQQIDEIMAAGVYKLNPSYAQVFKNQCQHVFEPTENIFEVAFYNPTGQRGNASLVGSYNAPTTTNGVYPSTNPRWRSPRPFRDGFLEADLRRDFAVATYSINAEGTKIPLFTARQDEQWTPGKWSREYQTNETMERSYTHINWVIMRYADLLLLRAEVENELNGGPNALAYDAINQVRRRAFGVDVPGNRIAIELTNSGTGYTAAGNVPNVAFDITGGGGSGAAVSATTLTNGGVGAIVTLRAGEGYTSAPAVTVKSTDKTGAGSGATAAATLLPKPTMEAIDLPTGLNKEDFLKAVQQERAWELCFEGMRRSDLIRWGVLADKIKETNDKVKAIRPNYFYAAFENFIPGKHELFPYPQNETDVNKNINRQNPGY